MELSLLDWALVVGVSVLFALFAAMFWVWGGILYYAVLMDSERQRPPTWMVAFHTKPIWTISVDGQRKTFRFLQAFSVILFVAFLALGLLAAPADFRKGWGRGLEVAVAYFLPLVMVWLSAVLGFERYARRVRSGAKARIE